MTVSQYRQLERAAFLAAIALAGTLGYTVAAHRGSDPLVINIQVEGAPKVVKTYRKVGNEWVLVK
jgi:anti-sigma-K factor RskA